MKLLIGAVTNSSTYTALVLLTSPYDDWINPQSPHWRHVWRHTVFLGATMWKAVLSKDSDIDWFPYEEEEPWLVDVNQIMAAALFLEDRPWSDWAGKALYRLVYEDKSKSLAPPEEGFMLLWDLYEPAWHEIAEEISRMDFSGPSRRPTKYGYALDELMWTALSFFPPGSVPQESGEITVGRVAARGYGRPLADLRFLWQGDSWLKGLFPERRWLGSQIAWGIDTSQMGGLHWSGSILYYFPALMACVTLYNIPYHGYYASLYTTYVHDEKGERIGKMGVWAIVATHIPDSGGASMREVVWDTLAILCYPQVEEAIRKATEGEYRGCHLFARDEKDGKVGIQKIGEVR